MYTPTSKSLSWAKQKGRCGTKGCTLKDFHEGLCSHLQLDDGTIRSRKRARPKPPEYPERPSGKAPPRRRRLRADHGVIAEVERLVACRTSFGKQRFAVRWKELGQSGDSWELEEDISPVLIAEFEATPLYKAPYHGALFLVETILERRVHDGRKQSRIKWFGYDWDPTWIDDDKLIEPSASFPKTPPSDTAAEAPTPGSPALTKFCIQRGPACGKMPRKALFCPECGAAQQ